MKTYEYNTVVSDHEMLETEALNKLGQQGWRLIRLHKGWRNEMDQDYREYIIDEFTHVFIREKDG